MLLVGVEDAMVVGFTRPSGHFMHRERRGGCVHDTWLRRRTEGRIGRMGVMHAENALSKMGKGRRDPKPRSIVVIYVVWSVLCIEGGVRWGGV